MGLFTLGLLAGHGALFLVWRTTGPVQERSRLVARRVWRVVVPLWVVVTLATAWIQPEIFANLLARPWSIALVLFMLAGIGGVFKFLNDGRELAAFLSSAAFILGLMAATMAGNYPFWLRSTVDPSYGLTAANTAVGKLRVANRPALVCRWHHAGRGLFRQSLSFDSGKSWRGCKRSRLLAGAVTLRISHAP